jgi:uncharacterized damage-inducible protein DinB
MPASHCLTMNAMAYNNAWANHRLHSACARLTPLEFEATRTSFFPSIQATLNHILTVDMFYVDALEGGTLGPAAWANPLPCPTLAELQPAQAAIVRRLIAWCSALDENGPNQIIHVHRGTYVQNERADRLLLHLFQHQIHRRGQATLCLAEHMSHRRSSMNFSQSPKYSCARLSSRSLDGGRKEFGESETALMIVPMHRAAPCSPAQAAGPCQGANSNNEGNRQTVPSGNEKRRIIRAMRCIKRRADSSSEEARRSPGKRRMFWCSLA